MAICHATILKTIQARNYVVREKSSLYPSELGFQVNDFLVAALPELFQVDFTRQMEEQLDRIEDGKVKWTNMLHTFYDQFTPWLEKAKAAGAVNADKSEMLLDLFKDIKWHEPVKVGRRTYDDKKFHDSIAQKYAGNHRLSPKQFASLVELGAKYADQIPNLDAVAEQIGATEELKAAKEKLAALQERLDEEKNIKLAGESPLLKVFQAFNDVKWEEPSGRRGRTFDDKKFFQSLYSQVESGRVLSDKQIDVLKKLAIKYRDSISDFNMVAGELKIEEQPENNSANPGNQAEVEQLLAKLANVKEWAEPVKQGRRVYDDQAFYHSLSDQYNNGKTLSDKQIAALKKLADKYEAK